MRALIPTAHVSAWLSFNLRQTSVSSSDRVMNVLEITYQKKEDLAVLEPYPPMPQAVKLLDGTMVTVRPISPDDAPRLQALFGRLSPSTVYLRFLEYRKELTHEQAARLASVDYQKQMALVATREEEDIIAVARYAVTQPGAPYHAEVAIVVEDQYQGRGLGALLLRWLLAYARMHDVRTIHATVHPNNTQILRFIEHSGLPAEKRLEAGAWDIQVKLEPEPFS
jgi:acetyltransferase